MLCSPCSLPRRGWGAVPALLLLPGPAGGSCSCSALLPVWRCAPPRGATLRLAALQRFAAPQRARARTHTQVMSPPASEDEDGRGHLSGSDSDSDFVEGPTSDDSDDNEGAPPPHATGSTAPVPETRWRCAAGFTRRRRRLLVDDPTGAHAGTAAGGAAAGGSNTVNRWDNVKECLEPPNGRADATSVWNYIRRVLGRVQRATPPPPTR